jgi:single-strand DNA-binding protein
MFVRNLVRKENIMSLNKVILIGNVGKDPDVRYFDTGSALANFPMATSERGYTLANGTEVPERTEWHNIVVRRDQVAFVERWVKKGASVYVEGKLRTRTYEDQAGVRRYVTEVYADRVEFFSFAGRRDEAQSGQSAGQPAQSGQPAARPAAQPQDPSHSQPPAGGASSDAVLPSTSGEADDLPF